MTNRNFLLLACLRRESFTLISSLLLPSFLPFAFPHPHHHHHHSLYSLSSSVSVARLVRILFLAIKVSQGIVMRARIMINECGIYPFTQMNTLQARGVLFLHTFYFIFRRIPPYNPSPLRNIGELLYNISSHTSTHVVFTLESDTKKCYQKTWVRDKRRIQEDKVDGRKV